MSNLPQQTTIEQYVGDGTTDTYIYTFLVPTTADMAVYVTPAGQDPNPSTDLVNPSNYTVTGAGSVSGGTVIFDSAYIPANGDAITLSRNMEFSLDTEFSTAQNFNGANLDGVLQRIELQSQQLNTLQGERNLSYIINSFTPPGTEDTQIPLLSDGQSWKKQGTRIIPYDIAEVPSASMLRSDLASAVNGADGALIVGFYSAFQGLQTTVHAALARLETLTFMPPGRVMASYYDETVPWLPMNDGTIGKTGSSATTRANDDTIDLYLVLWTKSASDFQMFNPSGVPIARGSNYADDFAAGNVIKLGYTAGRAMANIGTGGVQQVFTADSTTDVISFTNPNSFFTGTAITVSNIGGALPGGLAEATTYYYIYLTSGTGKLATSLANAQAGTAIDLTSAGTGTNLINITFSDKTEGQYEGEYQHAPLENEGFTHEHILVNGLGDQYNDADAGVGSVGGNNELSAAVSSANKPIAAAAGGGQPFNITQPTFYVPLWIHM